MDFPSTVSFKFITKNQIPIANLIVLFELLARSKNDYSIGRFMTDEKGEICLTKQFIDNEIRKEMNTYPMDYNCRLTDCKDNLQVIIEDADSITKHIKHLSKYYPNESHNLMELFSISVNKNFMNQTHGVEINKSIRKVQLTL